MKPKTKPSKRPNRWLLRGGLLGLLLLGWTLTACLPASYSIQIHSVQDCSGVKLSTGSLDVGISRYYKMRVELANWLTVTGNPAQFAPETNYIEISQAEVFFEYPTNFSVQGDVLHTGSANALQTSIYARLEPSVVGSFDSTGATGQAGAVTVNTTVVEFPLVTPLTARLWATASELKPTTSGAPSTFSVIASVRFIGKTGTGSSIETPVIRFPLIICKGCLDNTLGLLQGCRTGGSGTTGSSCIGQDGFCLEPITKEGNP